MKGSSSSLEWYSEKSIFDKLYVFTTMLRKPLFASKSSCRVSNELTKKHISAAEVSSEKLEVRPVGTNLLARQETMPFHIQPANPRRYRGLPMSPPLVLFSPVFLSLTAGAVLPPAISRRRNSEVTFPVLSRHNKVSSAREKHIYFQGSRTKKLNSIILSFLLL